MILVASQRGGPGQLAAHLLNARDNDHVTVEDLRGFVADDLHGAFAEVDAIAKGTRCRQFLFSLSLNPPKDASIALDDILTAVERAEEALGLSGQPRAVIVHEKNGRRHAHVVWSRIDADAMKAINLPFFKTRLNALSRELYLEHGWELPEGYRTNGWKNPLNFTLADWQQAQRVGLDPREIRQIFQNAWQHSDNLASFRNALEEHGYFLARGDRRAFVAVDVHGEIYAVTRMAGVKSKDVQNRLGSPDALPSVEQVRTDVRRRLTQKLRGFIREDRAHQADELKPLQNQLADLVQRQRTERETLQARQDERWREESKARSDRLHKGLLGVWELLTGKAAAVKKDNEREAYQAHLRDRAQRERLYEAQMKERQALAARMDALKARHRQERLALTRRVIGVLRDADDIGRAREPARRRQRSRDFDLEL
jgi:hypothetical protein